MWLLWRRHLLDRQTQKHSLCIHAKDERNRKLCAKFGSCNLKNSSLPFTGIDNICAVDTCHLIIWRNGKQQHHSIVSAIHATILAQISAYHETRMFLCSFLASKIIHFNTRDEWWSMHQVRKCWTIKRRLKCTNFCCTIEQLSGWIVCVTVLLLIL